LCLSFRYSLSLCIRPLEVKLICTYMKIGMDYYRHRH
jgi:hypothetical protein